MLYESEVKAAVQTMQFHESKQKWRGNYANVAKSFS